VLLDALKDRGIQGQDVLEIGCGAGSLHHQLLLDGASSAVGIELSADSLAKARARSGELGLGDRTDYLEGDFVKLADRIETADITILDKVVHCYRDPRTLIQRSCAHTGSLYAISFLRSRWILRVCLRLLGPFARLFLPFRVRFSRPELVRTWIRDAGFERVFHSDGETFHSEIYRRR